MQEVWVRGAVLGQGVHALAQGRCGCVQEVFSPAMEEYLGPTFTWARSVKTRGLDSLGLVASTE